MRFDQIVSVAFSVIAVLLLFSARTSFGGDFVGFDFRWFTDIFKKKEIDEECQECFGRGYNFIGDSVLECGCTEVDENEK